MRGFTHLALRYRLIGSYTGTIMICIAGLIAASMVPGIIYAEYDQMIPVLLSFLSMLGLGLILRLIANTKGLTSLDFNESSIVVFLSWMLISVISAIPYMLNNGLSFSQSMFESVSGWTTTGLSMLNLSVVSKTMLFYRAWSQFLGGAGMAIIVIASLTGINANHLYSAEGKGNLIKPNVIASARIVVVLYTAYLIFGVLAYLICGMSLFDALVHCFTAISTGGFGNYSSSIGHFDAPMIEFVTIILMILGGLNFVTAYLLYKRRMISVFRNGELRVFVVLACISSVFVFLSTSTQLYAGLGKQIRIAIFETVSALTTTGFSITSYVQPAWPESSILVLILLMLAGGGACSTAGGIKQYRVYLLYKSVVWHFKRSIMPRNAVVREYIWDAEQKDYVSQTKFLSVANYVMIYLFTYAIGVIIIASTTDPVTGKLYTLRDSMFEFASSLGTVGLSIGITNINTPVHVLWTQTVGMFLGRLEFFVVAIALSKLGKDTYKLFKK